MAWQNSIGMGPGSAGTPASSNEAPGNVAQPQGTEYTLQGVMRFLQTEWHRHERDRNAWQIERAEMKARIGKLEGDLRTNKKLRESMEKHIKMLENALRRSREKNTNGQEAGNGVAETSETKQSAKSSPRSKPNPAKPHNSFLRLESDEYATSNIKHEAERDRSRVYLGKCIEEFHYHVFSSIGTHQQYLDEHEQLGSGNEYSNHQQPQEVSLADVYAQQKQKMGAPGSLVHSSAPNHQPPPVPRVNEVPPLSRGSQTAEEPVYMTRDPPQPARPERTYTAIRDSDSRAGHEMTRQDDSSNRIHTYNSYGDPITTHAGGDGPSPIPPESHIPEADGWDFDDSPEEQRMGEPSARDFPPPQRPDTDTFPSATNLSVRSQSRGAEPQKRRTSLSQRRRSDGSHELRELNTGAGSAKGASGEFKIRFALRGHLDVVRSVIFTGGGSPSAPEICTAGDDGVIKRWIAVSSTQAKSDDLELKCEMTHRGHNGPVLCLAASPIYQPFSNGGRAVGDGWVFSGGSDGSVRVWERGRVDPKATLDGHTDAVWTICVLPGTSGSVLGGDLAAHHGGQDRTLLVSGAADGTILVWACSSPPTIASPHTGSRRGTGGSRRANSVSSGSNFPSSPQPNASSATTAAGGRSNFLYSLVHRIPPRAGSPAPASTCVCPLSPTGETFVVSFNDAEVIVFDTKTGEEIIAMASQETYDGTPATGVNSIVATTTQVVEAGGDAMMMMVRGGDDEGKSRIGVEGVILSGHEDRFVRFFDASSGQSTYAMLAHPSSISALSLSPADPSAASNTSTTSGSIPTSPPPSSSSSSSSTTTTTTTTSSTSSRNELVSAGHDASLRFWSLEKRSCVQEIVSHRPMRGEGVCAVVWSLDGRWVVSGGGDGVVKVWARERDGGGGGITHGQLVQHERADRADRGDRRSVGSVGSGGEREGRETAGGGEEEGGEGWRF